MICIRLWMEIEWMISEENFMQISNEIVLLNWTIY